MARQKFGRDERLEEAADELLRSSVKKNILGLPVRNEWMNLGIQMQYRQDFIKRHEVYVPSGAPDASEREGMFHRVLNRAVPRLNARSGRARHSRGGGNYLGDNRTAMGMNGRVLEGPTYEYALPPTNPKTYRWTSQRDSRSPEQIEKLKEVRVSYMPGFEPPE